MTALFGEGAAPALAEQYGEEPCPVFSALCSRARSIRSKRDVDIGPSSAHRRAE